MSPRFSSRINLQSLPRFGEGWTFLYAEHVRVDRDDSAILLQDQAGAVPIPVAALSVLLLGPGSTVTHAAMGVLAECGCSVVWCGEGGTRFYASGMGETRRSANLLRQAALWADPETRMEVVLRMYRMRFAGDLDPDLTLQQLRGWEGVRVRDAYRKASEESGVPWSGRAYQPDQWQHADPVNRALSAANACLYALCHAAIVSTGFSPAMGFIHTGKALAFVYDIADLYKAEITVPAAFRATAEGTEGVEQRVRRTCRDVFFERKLLARIVPDIQQALGMARESVEVLVHGVREEDSIVGIWDPHEIVAGGVNHAEEQPVRAGETP
jgi:CRISPR-associated protein Cas1